MQFAKLTPREVDAVKLSAMGSFLQGGGQTPGGGITTYRAASPHRAHAWHTQRYTAVLQNRRIDGDRTLTHGSQLQCPSIMALCNPERHICESTRALCV